MAIYGLDFGEQVSEWARQTEARMLAVFRASVQELIRRMSLTRNEGGRLPIRTGNLRRSLMVSTAGLPPMGGSRDRFDSLLDYNLVIAQTKLGDKIYAAFRAAYAMRMEYGFVGRDSMGRDYNQSGNYFVASAVLDWPNIVKEQAAKIQGRVEARGRS